MWVKKTPEEIANSSDMKRKAALVGSVCVSLGSTVFFSLVQKRGDKIFMASLEQIQDVLPFSISIGIFFGVVNYLGFRRDLTLFCTKCEKSYNRSLKGNCSCGGRLEPLRNYKWADDV